MPITYQRDDQRRRIVVTTIGIVGLDDMTAVMDRQAAEGTWAYGTLYDSRRVASVASQTDVRAGLKHVESLSRDLCERRAGAALELFRLGPIAGPDDG